MDLFDKYAGVEGRHDQLLEIGAEPFGLEMEEMLSATEAIIGGRRTILFGTNNYLGLTFNEACIEAVVDGSRWRERFGSLSHGRGLGLACGSYLTGAGLPIHWNHLPQSAVQLKLARSGAVTAYCGEAEIGQGSDSVLAACVAEVLGIGLDDVLLCVGDTGLTPVDLGSYSSRVTLMVGQAAIQAAERARDVSGAVRRSPPTGHRALG